MSPRGGDQVIPRPENFRIGPPAPWETGEWKDPASISVADVIGALDRAGLNRIPVSHHEAWLGTALTSRQRLAAEKALASKRSTSAVLVPLFDRATGNGNQVNLVFTRRSRNLRSHTGEVSFPGGRVDDGELPVAAAIREADEEVGISPSDVEILGHLEAMPTIASESWIIPYVGVLDPESLVEGSPVLVPNPSEVDRIFDVSIVELLEPGVHREEIWEFPGFGEGPVNFFEVEGDTIWGATARMLRNLIEILLA